MIGGGTAGVAAAKESANRGARVTLFESSASLQVERSAWSSLLDETATSAAEGRTEELRHAGVETKLGATVRAVDVDGTVRAHDGSWRFDSVVLATGARQVEEGIPGNHRAGVHVLRDERAYAALGRDVRSYSQVALCGSGPAALEVANWLVSRGIRVTLFTAAGIAWSLLSGDLSRRLEHAIAAAGVSQVSSKPERIAGIDKVEAVIAGGSVYPCQALVIVPRTRPNPLGIPIRKGRLGGVVVNSEMKSDWKKVFAAGACAEVTAGSATLNYDSDSSARAMGAAAGANSCGAHVSPRISGCIRKEVFGIGIVVAGLGLEACLSIGLRAQESTAIARDQLVCSLVYEEGSLRLWGVQLIGRGAGAYEQAAAFMVTGSIGMDEVAYQEFPPSVDPSPLILAATEVLRRRS